MKYISIIMIFFSLGCFKVEKCETIINGNDQVDCCGQGIGAQKEICDCFDQYNKENGTNYETKCK